jgi:hypothetical protein
MASVLLALFVFSFVSAPATLAISKDDVRIEAQKFIDEYSAMWTKLRYESSEAEWKSNTMIIEGDDTNAKATVAANERRVKGNWFLFERNGRNPRPASQGSFGFNR